MYSAWGLTQEPQPESRMDVEGSFQGQHCLIGSSHPARLPPPHARLVTFVIPALTRRMCWGVWRVSYRHQATHTREEDNIVAPLAREGLLPQLSCGQWEPGILAVNKQYCSLGHIGTIYSTNCIALGSLYSVFLCSPTAEHPPRSSGPECDGFPATIPIADVQDKRKSGGKPGFGMSSSILKSFLSRGLDRSQSIQLEGLPQSHPRAPLCLHWLRNH